MMPHRRSSPHWLYVEIAQVDTVAMEAASAYDDDYRQPVKTDSDGDGLGEPAREEKAVVVLKGGIERDREELQRLARGGDVPDASIGVVISTYQLAAKNLIGADGSLGIQKGDRLVRILDRAGNPTETFDRVKLYCIHARRLNADLRGTSNHALFIFEERQAGMV